jgi:vitamin B12/bleomycin/antimicrobial peptide transport system ATP-binding/permease protein
VALTIPGFLVVAAAIYAVAASGAMAVIGRRFIAVSENKDQAEAEYRYVLTRLRENAESIALLQGTNEERSGVDKSFKTVLRAWRDICTQHMRTTIISQTSGYIAHHHSVRTQISGRLDDARRNHAGRVGIHNRSSGLQLAGR